MFGVCVCVWCMYVCVCAFGHTERQLNTLEQFVDIMNKEIFAYLEILYSLIKKNQQVKINYYL